MIARLYLRASTKDQDAARAKESLEGFAVDKGLTVVGSYAENESGASLQRPELFRLLADSRPGDVLLIEQVDRLSRLTEADWRRLRAEIDRKELRIVALDLPTSWSLANAGDEFTGRMLGAINAMLLDMLAAIARKDYLDRRRRQQEGIAKAKSKGAYRGRPENAKRNAGIARMLKAKTPWTEIIETTECSRATVAKIARRVAEQGAAQPDRD